MKRTIQIQLRPTPEQVSALEQTMRQFNIACNWVAERAFERKLANAYALHKRHYYEVRQRFDLPADIAIQTTTAFRRLTASVSTRCSAAKSRWRAELLPCGGCREASPLER